MEICKKEVCIGCNLCKVICPKQCITLENDLYDNVYPIIDEEVCIKCNLCSINCPQNTEINDNKENYKQKVFAAVSTDEEIKERSASGGIATELYRYILNQNGCSSGVVLDENLEAKYILIENEKYLKKTQNSKYVFSSMGNIYLDIEKQLKENKKFIFIGLPCQVAAIKNYVKLNIKDEEQKRNIFYVDIICHGLMSKEYFKEHIFKVIGNNKKENIQCFFRDPKYGTNNFMLTILESEKLIYKKSVKNTDNYQICYHNAIAYRENCYNCKYANSKRLGDFTIGDFSGYGAIEKDICFSDKVSCVIVNTLKGEKLLKELINNNHIIVEERPRDEAFKYEKQLNFPSVRHYSREKFLDTYAKTKSFTKSANKSIVKIKLKNFLLNKSGYIIFRKEISKFFFKHPKLKEQLKKWCKR